MKVGILGGGQLGRMLALEAHRLGIHASCLDTTMYSPASFVTETVYAELTETETCEDWARSNDILTYEFENFPPEFVGHLSDIRPLSPGVNAIIDAQNRVSEKSLFTKLEIPVAPYRIIDSVSQLDRAIREIGTPFIAKTVTGGYDGKGQVLVKQPADLHKVVALSRSGQVVLEKFVEFEREVSIIGVRSASGEIVTYPIATNVHKEGILSTTWIPSHLPSEIEDVAKQHVTALLKHFDYVGVLTLELFVTAAGLLANEFAPRVHNSGHWTLDGAETSQFENHIRAICGLPLGSTDALCPTAMVNCIGSVPPIEKILKIPGVHFHSYEKEPRPNRKLAHINVTAPDEDTLESRVDAVLNLF